MVTFTCSAVDLPTNVLRWFVNDDLFASYDVIPSDVYPLTVELTNTTYNDLVGGVDVQILAASLNEDDQSFASFLSTMTANISALQDVGVTNVSCGRFGRLTRTYANITYNSSAGKSNEAEKVEFLSFSFFSSTNSKLHFYTTSL